MTDADLTAGFLKGDKQATDRIIGWIRAVVCHSAWHDFDQAEDAVADTTLKLLSLLRKGAFRGEASLKTYVSRIARYTMIDLLRHRKRTQELIIPENVEQSKSPTPEQEYETGRQHETFQRILSLIDDRCRHLWHLVFHEKLAYKEIAKREGLTVTALKMRIFRCKEEAIALRKEIER